LPVGRIVAMLASIVSCMAGIAEMTQRCCEIGEPIETPSTPDEVGMIDVDVRGMEIDFLCAGSYKLFTPPQIRSSIVTFYCNREPAELQSVFASRNIDVTAREGVMRIAMIAARMAEVFASLALSSKLRGASTFKMSDRHRSRLLRPSTSTGHP
jgi:hypothetical protein